MAKNRKRRGPTDPAEIARQRAELERHTRRTPSEWGPNEDALSREANANVAIEAATREKTQRITRYDCFAILHSRKGLSGDPTQNDQRLAAVRRLELDMAIRFRLDGKDDSMGIKSTGEPGGFSRRAIDAGRRIDTVLDMTGALSSRVLQKLLEPAVLSGQPVNNWRAVVQQVTGEVFDHGQTAVVRAACQNLFEAWGAYDNRERRAA